MYPHRIRLRGPWQYGPLTRTVVDSGGVCAEPGACPSPGRLKIPASWQGTPLESFCGRVEFRRTFRSPRTLDPEEHVWLVFEGVDYFAEVSLNGTLLGRHAGFFETFEFDVTRHRKLRNELTVRVDVPREADPDARRLLRGYGEGAGGGIWNDVVLEIRPDVRLRNVRVRPVVSRIDGGLSPPYKSDSERTIPIDLRVSGKLVGAISAPLALDLTLNGQDLGHQGVKASSAGIQFEFTAPAVPLSAWHPWDRGAAAVHEVCLELHGAARTLDRETITFGVRDSRAALSSPPEPTVVARPSLFEPWDRRVEAWRDAGVTCIRVPGRVLPADLYEHLDRTGIAVWQDFPAGPRHANDAATIAEAVRQARVLVRQLRDHPSIAGWCCGGSSGQEPTSLQTAVRNTIHEEDPERPCVLAKSLGRTE